jgi:hypothetical protein
MYRIRFESEVPDVIHRLKDLRKALASLSLNQGRIARANARRKYLRAAKGLRHTIDSLYPVVPLKAKERPRGLTPGQRLAAQKLRLRARGWVPIPYAPGTSARSLLFVAFTQAGLRVKTLNGRSVDSFNMTVAAEIWAPQWAINIGTDAKKLRAAKHNPVLRKAYAAEALLKVGGAP